MVCFNKEAEDERINNDTKDNIKEKLFDKIKSRSFDLITFDDQKLNEIKLNYFLLIIRPDYIIEYLQ